MATRIAHTLHVCTARPPSLLNHLLQVTHCTAPFCKWTGLLYVRSSIHLCLSVRFSLKCLKQVEQRTSVCGSSATCPLEVPSVFLLRRALQPSLDVTASLYHLSLSVLHVLHLPYGPLRGWHCFKKNQKALVWEFCDQAYMQVISSLLLLILSSINSLSPHLLVQLM